MNAMTEKPITAVSLFAGIGGFDLALQRAGVEVVAAVEIDDAARGVIADRFPDTRLFTDVRKVTGDDLRAAGFVPERGIITAGWPCQGNSVAGRRGGLADPRSGLWRHVVRLLADTGAAWFIGENVPGLLSVNDGEDFGVLLGDLANLGMGVCWRVLDAQHFGVPQRRRRVFIVGRAGGDPRGSVQVLLEPEGRAGNPAPLRTPRPVVAALTADGVGTCGADDNQAQAGHLIASALTAREGKGPDSDATTTLVTHALTAEGHDASEDGTGRGTPLVPMPSAAVRRLTPLECERLQGFPDGWTSTSIGRPQADAARYRQLGNAIAVPVGQWVARRTVAVHQSAALKRRTVA